MGPQLNASVTSHLGTVTKDANVRTLRLLVILSIAATACVRPVNQDSSSSGPASDPAREVEAAESAWAVAMRDRDSLALERLLAPEFVVEAAAPGRPADQAPRTRWLDNTLHRLRLDSVAIRPVRVTVHPPRGDSATAELWLWWKPFRVATDNRLEDTWVRRDGRWQVTRRIIRETRLAAP